MLDDDDEQEEENNSYARLKSIKLPHPTLFQHYKKTRKFVQKKV